MNLPPFSHQRIDFCIQTYITNNPFTQVKGAIEECLTWHSDDEEVIVSLQDLRVAYNGWWRKYDDSRSHSQPRLLGAKRLTSTQFQEALETALRLYKVEDKYIIKGKRPLPPQAASLYE